MPRLLWASKTEQAPLIVNIELDSLVFPDSKGYPDAECKNQVILGDNLSVISALLAEFEGRIKVIYADPPFFTNRRFQARIGHGEDSRRPQDWRLAEGYPDSWTTLDDYLDMLYPRLALMYRLLAPNGTLYLHLDWHVNSYARILLDEIFGDDRFLNEVIWIYHGPSPIRTAFNRKHDTILVYTKTSDYLFNADAIRQPYNPVTVRTFNSSPKAGFGKVPDLKRGKVPEDWWYFPVVARLHSERTGYPTQKPESLLERIILASSNPGDMIADFFCGSGTTAVVANRLERNFIISDIVSRAIQTTYARLVANQSNPFTLSHVQGTDINLLPKMTGDSFNCNDDEIILNAHDLDEIVYWEVDPDWDRRIFRSAGQVTRKRVKGQINTRMNIHIQNKKNVCLRYFTRQGEIRSIPPE
jgi:DNA modification methylase